MVKSDNTYRNRPLLVVSDGSGNIFEIPELLMAGMELSIPVLPENNTIIPLPQGSDIFELPGRVPVGYDPREQKFVYVPEYQGKPVFSAAAFMAPAHIQYYRSAFRTMPDAPRLPLYSYTALGWHNNTFYVTGARIDPDKRHDPEMFNQRIVKQKAQLMLKRFSGNRLVQHLIENCVFQYNCPNAKNFVLERWECPVPVSVSCNAECLGCISRQPESSCIASSQERLSFTPSVDEIIAYTVPHLEKAPNAIISFGQGCEGEPMLSGELIEEAIYAIRKRTSQGVININTNASRPDMVERLCAAGLDSIRVSLNSAQKNLYETYYHPKNYGFEDILESLRIVRSFNRWASMNYFVFPGLTDHPEEIAALERIISNININMIQTRNMNIDPEWYINTLGLQRLSSDFTGIDSWIAYIKKKFPEIIFGYFNPYDISNKR
jgi:pyruvate-formate lyase-activating enzyme